MRDAVAAGRRESTCIVHIGMHKTGSTVLQQYLQTHTERLAASGILVPVSGRLAATPDGCGHHCIAWDLLGADPGAAVDGSLEHLIEEIRTAAMPIVCISSEELSHLWAVPNNMQRLRAGLRGIGYRTVIVAYVRPQVDYLEALYAQVAQHAPVRDFWSCYREVLAHGAVDLWPQNRFAAPLDYDRFLLEPFRRIFGARNVIVRPFRRFASPLELVRDFMRIVAGRSFSVDAAGPPVGTSNARADFATVIAAIAGNRDGSGNLNAGDPATAERAREVGGPFEVLRAHEIARVCWRFARTNLWLMLRYRIIVGCVSGVRLRRLASRAAAARSAERVRLLRAMFDEPAARHST